MLFRVVLTWPARYHILQGVHTNISNITFFPTTLNNESYTNVTGGQVVEGLSAGDNITFFSGLLSNSSVLNSTNFTGGVVHTIDRFLMIPTSISETAIALNLTSAVGALGNLSLAEEAESTPDLTVFIPNNEAFQRVGGNLANLSMDNLTDILLYHVIAGQVLYSTSLENDTELETLQGSNLTVTIDDGTVFINNAEVIQPNVLVANGVVHVIDRLLNPNNATAEPNASATEESFPNPTSASDVPFTSGVPTPTSSIATEAATSAQESATSEGGAWRPIETGAMGMAALLGGAAAVMNL